MVILTDAEPRREPSLQLPAWIMRECVQRMEESAAIARAFMPAVVDAYGRWYSPPQRTGDTIGVRLPARYRAGVP
jgi:hypothetical protein